ncbi:MAG: efflux RND transporter periplasmic adaptor subunit [Bacteroidetes bacterium]|nr:efflux RND transporter periplasmic adaptor subunit [Bacteroidota bacterium]
MKKAIVTGLVIGLLIILQSCHQVEETEKIIVAEVNTELLTEINYAPPASCTGRLAGKEETKLSFKTGGIIGSILVDEGQYVTRGQVLAQLNTGEIQAQVDQAQSGVEKAKRDFGRARNLYNDSVATLEMYQDAQTGVDLAQARYEVAAFNLKYSTIAAPASGKILKRFAQPNELIAAGYPVFLFVSGEKSWVVRVDVTDKDIMRIRIGDSASVQLDAYPDTTFSARVTETGTFADPYTGTYEIEIMFDNNELPLISGLIASTRIFPSKKEKYIRIPIDAVSEADGQYANIMVFKDGDWAKKKARIAWILDDAVLVRQGFTVGEQVIVSGGSFLRPGDKVKSE